MGPADLAQFQRQLAISRPAVATDDAGNRLAQQGLKALKTPPQVDHEEGHRRGCRRPQPALLSLLAPAALVGVLHRGLTNGRLCLLIRTGQGRTGLGFERADGAQGGRHVEDGLHDFFHSPSADMKTAGEVRHHRGQAWSDDMSADLRRDLASIEVATAGADARVPLMLGDHRRQFGEFGHLMPGRLGVTRPGLGGQHRLAVGADRGYIGDDIRDPLRREAVAMVSRMSSLTARLAPLGVLTTGLGASSGLAEGGMEELDEFRFSRSWRSRTRASSSAIRLRS